MFDSSIITLIVTIQDMKYYMFLHIFHRKSAKILKNTVI